MYTYKTELLWVSTKLVSDKANQEDAEVLDKFLNEKAAEGWALVTFDYMATGIQIRGAFVITFRRKAE